MNYIVSGAARHYVLNPAVPPVRWEPAALSYEVGT